MRRKAERSCFGRVDLRWNPESVDRVNGPPRAFCRWGACVRVSKRCTRRKVPETFYTGDWGGHTLTHVYTHKVMSKHATGALSQASLKPRGFCLAPSRGYSWIARRNTHAHATNTCAYYARARHSLTHRYRRLRRRRSLKRTRNTRSAVYTERDRCNRPSPVRSEMD